jgi:hypothetical protein
MKFPEAEEQYSADEAASRRDEVIRRMANTPPQPKISKRAPAKAAKEPADDPGLSRTRRLCGASAKPPAQE